MHWFNNLGIVFIDILALRLLLPFLAIDTAILAENGGWGLLNNVSLVYWLEVTQDDCPLNSIVGF